jgi:diaminopimelate epimerase
MLEGRPFWKLTGSGNDFVFFDARGGADSQLVDAELIGALCDRRAGVGADGIVLFEEPVESDELYSIRYFNRDGSLAEFCGNAALCSVRLAHLLGVIQEKHDKLFHFHSSSGKLTGRLRLAGARAGDPEVSMPHPLELTADCDIARNVGEQRIGFVRVGVPHFVLLVDDLETVDVLSRGRELRRHPSLRAGANVNFVRRLSDGAWAMRTYERGVEAETHACGSGSVAAAALLAAWDLEAQGRDVRIRTRGGRDVVVSWEHLGTSPEPFLRGEGRFVFSGILEEPIISTEKPST